MTSQQRSARPPLHLVFPAVLVAAAMLLPLAYLAARALGAGGEGWALLMHPRLLKVVGNSLLLAGAVTFSAAVIAVPLAWLTSRTDLPGRRFWMIGTALPLVIPSYVGAYTLVAALGPHGLAHQLVTAPLGLEQLPSIYGFTGAWVTLTLFAYPYVLLTVRAALQGLDPALEEAARTLGDSPWKTFWRVVLPQLYPALASGSLLVALYVLSDFGAVSILRFNTFTRAIYLQYTSSFDRGFAALLALVLVALTVILLVAEGRVQALARAYFRPIVSRQMRIIRLGAWRIPALIFTVLVLAAGVGIPISVTVFWLAPGLSHDELSRLLIGPAWRSLVASGGAAALAVLGALPVALLVVRYPGWFSRFIERASVAGYALPGIVIALSLVFFAANFAVPLYQTIFLLVFAYVVRFLPEAIGPARAAVRQISPRMEEAARSLGSGTARILLTITIPLTRPGLLAGAALVFLTSMKELPATLLLAPTGYDTLATRVWSATQAAIYVRAAAPALALIAVSALSIQVILARDPNAPS